MRAYEQSHPWIKFENINLQDAPYTLWLLLGRAQATVGHILTAPVSPEQSGEFRRIYLAKGALATTAIEGNTLSLEEARMQIEGELKLPPSKAYLGQEIENVVLAYNVIDSRVLRLNRIELTPAQLDEYNKLVLNELSLEEGVVPGELRQHGVRVTGVGYKGAPAEDLPYLIEEFCTWFNRDFKGPPGYDVAFGILKAIIAHVYFAWIHPYGDGNGRTARLIEFQIMLSVGVPDTAAHLLSNFYNKTRTQYYRQLQKTSVEYQSSGLLSFAHYALQGFVDSLDEQIEEISDHQLQVQWRNYVYDLFRTQDTITGNRRRRLALDIADYYATHKDEPIPFNEVRHISPRIAEAYAGKTPITIQRDLNELARMDLIRRDKKAVVPNLEIMHGFKPRRRS